MDPEENEVSQALDVVMQIVRIWRFHVHQPGKDSFYRTISFGLPSCATITEEDNPVTKNAALRSSFEMTSKHSCRANQ